MRNSRCVVRVPFVHHATRNTLHALRFTLPALRFPPYLPGSADLRSMKRTSSDRSSVITR
jgi:hypothetical protein